MTEQSKYSKLMEAVLEAFRTKIGELATGEDKVIEKIVESGEDPGLTKSALLLGLGPDTIVQFGMRQLRHDIEIVAVYVCTDKRDAGALKRLRNIAGLGYDKIMEDRTLGGKVIKCMPAAVTPTVLSWQDEAWVLVMQRWVAWKLEQLT